LSHGLNTGPEIKWLKQDGGQFVRMALHALITSPEIRQEWSGSQDMSQKLTI
jgi:hypothetical protein